MSEKEALQGLNCPRCGGMITIPEGQKIVRCPYCDLRSVVSGQQGILRYQVPCKVDAQGAKAAFDRFLHSSMAIASNIARQAEVSETILVHLPFWTVWGHAVGWGFGEKKVGSGEHRHYEPREVRVEEDMYWSGAACDVGEFGVSRVDLTGRPLEPFRSETLHYTGLVFEPVGSAEEALNQARTDFRNRVQIQTKLDRTSQLFTRILNSRQGLVYYPLWVVRYLFRGRSFQVVIDGFSGEVLYGKAPGNTFYRAASLIGGMALGSFLAVDIPGWLLFSGMGDEDIPVVIVVGALAAGVAMMIGAWRKYRYGEHYEFKRFKESGPPSTASKLMGSDMKDIIQTLEMFK